MNNQDLIDQIREQVHKLSKWEASFVDGIETESDDVDEISDRQQEILEDIHDKACG